jgi:cytochrome b involved in lipid metabolism
VYDATSFLKDHPGGGDSILLVAGTDATDEFDAIHSQKAKKQLLQYCIGRLASTSTGAPPVKSLCQDSIAHLVLVRHAGLCDYTLKLCT